MIHISRTLEICSGHISGIRSSNTYFNGFLSTLRAKDLGIHTNKTLLLFKVSFQQDADLFFIFVYKINTVFVILKQR